MLERTVFCLTLALVLLLPAQAVTENRVGAQPYDGLSAKGNTSYVMVQIRTIRAAGRFDPEAGNIAEQPPTMMIDSRLRDIAPKLSRLPYRTFNLVSAEERIVPLRKKETMLINGGQALSLRPLYVEAKQVGMSLKWQDEAGADILNTRMHFDPDEGMLTGTDSSATSGVLLVIKVIPLKPEEGARPVTADN